MKKFICLFIAFLVVFTTGCAKTENKPFSKTEFIFDTFVTVTVFEAKNETLEECFEICRYYEKLFSKTIKTSDVSRLNVANGNAVEVNGETAEILKKSIEISKISSGKFDITVEPLMRLWDFKATKKQIPDGKAIKTELEKVGYKNIDIKGNKVVLKNGAKVDLGGVAKGFIADKIKEYLIKNNVQKALINIGGNILVLGKDSFKVGIQKPFGETGEYIATISLTDNSAVTSGNYQRYFEKDGEIYHHILNSKDGYPVSNELNSVTVISDNSHFADGLSTACFSLGIKEGLKLINSIENTEAIFIDKAEKITLSDGLLLKNGEIMAR